MSEHNGYWIEKLFEEHDDQFGKFDRIENPEHHRPDICAFLIVSRLVPGKGRIIAGASHDIIHIEPGNLDELAKTATEQDIINLIRCGVHLDDGYLAMFV